MKVLKAILILPGNVLIMFPAIILYFNSFRIIKISQYFSCFLVFSLFVGAIFLMFSTMKLFADVKCGSPAPWNPIDKLIVTGPYAYVRNPMLSGVFLFLLAESLLLQSWALFYYFLVFVIINIIYFPIFEEKDLLKRFGKEYEIYKRNVPRFIPRSTPWKY